MIEGSVSLNKKFDDIKQISSTNPVSKAISFVQEAAKLGCPANNGELRNSIFTDVTQDEGGTRGICYTNVAYGPYVEFGTGPKGQADHDGISPNVPVAYTQSQWWIHESQIDKKTAEKYHFFAIETKDGVFYQCTGQPAHPFMYPALKDHIEDVIEIISGEVLKQI